MTGVGRLLGAAINVEQLNVALVRAREDEAVVRHDGAAGSNCIKIGLPGKLILSKRKGFREVLFS